MTPLRSSRRTFAAVLAFVLVALASGSAAAPASGEPAAAAFRTGASPAVSSRIDVAAQRGISWRGGPIRTSTGETVTVFLSNSVPPEVSSPEAWAELIVRFTHGSELAVLTARIAPMVEIEQICGPQSLGCYRANVLVAPSEGGPDGTSAEEVLRHEYGHHVAFHRLNAPWRAIDWGPKHWASAANVCARTARSEAYPGDGGRNYALNPGEAWAETYRLMDERRAGITTGTWPIVAPSFYPSDAALAAAERDVLQPWTRGTTRSYQRRFTQGARRAWWIPLATPLDGELRLTASLPRGGLHEVALVRANRTTVLQRGKWISERVKRLARGICGQRTVFVRVTPRGTPGRVRLTVATP